MTQQIIKMITKAQTIEKIKKGKEKKDKLSFNESVLDRLNAIEEFLEIKENII